MLVMQLAKNTARAIPGVADYVPPDPPSDEEILAAQKAAAEQVRGGKRVCVCGLWVCAGP